MRSFMTRAAEFTASSRLCRFRKQVCVRRNADQLTCARVEDRPQHCPSPLARKREYKISSSFKRGQNAVEGHGKTKIHSPKRTNGAKAKPRDVFVLGRRGASLLGRQNTLASQRPKLAENDRMTQSLRKGYTCR